MDIENDISRFSKLHEWANHLSLEGDRYLLFPWKGQQPKNPIDKDVTDTNGIHWWAWNAKDIGEIPISGVGKDIIMRHPVYFTCCLRGVDSGEAGQYISGLIAIEKEYPDYETILKAQYPYVNSLEKIFHLESVRQIKAAEFAAHNIKAVFEEKCPEWLTTDERRDDALRRSGGDDETVVKLYGRSPKERDVSQARPPPVRKKSGFFKKNKN